MARKIRAKLIMELREQGRSRREISATRHMSLSSVCEVFDIAEERPIAWDAVKDMPEDEVYRLFYPGRHVRESFMFELVERRYTDRSTVVCSQYATFECVNVKDFFHRC